jgi:hypothetical protein
MATEFERRPISGWVMLPVLLILLAASVAGLIRLIVVAATSGHAPSAAVICGLIGLGVLILLVILLLCGFFTLQPNTAAVLILFGHYRGTARREGFHWANPFYTRTKISLRARNLNGEKLKVNDLRGNPIEIAAVVVWRVQNTAEASFDVDRYEEYVSVQSESAVRHLASRYPYDSNEEGELSLRGSMDEVSLALQEELQERLSKAGVVVEEARLSHLAYAPEIAGAMLRRQQADAVVAARSRIVEGAVGMVEMALEHLDRHHTIEMDDERRAAMVSNLLVVLCGEEAAHPVVNTGTLYQ